MIKAVIFDFFGVVGLSTYAVIADKYHFSADQHEQAWDLHRAWDAGFIDRHKFIADYANIIGISPDELKSSLAMAESGMAYNQAVLGIAKDLRKQHKIGLLTNVGLEAYRLVEPIVDHFDEVVASYQVKMAKPDEAIFELMAKRLGVDTSECIMIDDNEINCQGAESAGMNAILYQNSNDLSKRIKLLIP